jgi:hypothetical protein
MTTISAERASSGLRRASARSSGRGLEGDDILGGPGHVCDDEADTRKEFARMPLDLGDHPTRICPASRLIGEIGK